MREAFAFDEHNTPSLLICRWAYVATAHAASSSPQQASNFTTLDLSKHFCKKRRLELTVSGDNPQQRSRKAPAGLFGDSTIEPLNNDVMTWFPPNVLFFPKWGAAPLLRHGGHRGFRGPGFDGRVPRGEGLRGAVHGAPGGGRGGLTRNQTERVE
jgi:hypothetical protein